MGTPYNESLMHSLGKWAGSRPGGKKDKELSQDTTCAEVHGLFRAQPMEIWARMGGC